MLLAVIAAGTQSADVNKQYTHSELDVVVDSARLFDRYVLGLAGPSTQVLQSKKCQYAPSRCFNSQFPVEPMLALEPSTSAGCGQRQNDVLLT